MTRARGLALVGACFAVLAAFTIAASSARAGDPFSRACGSWHDRLRGGRQVTSTASGARLDSRHRAARVATADFVGGSGTDGRTSRLIRERALSIPAQSVDSVSPNAGASGVGRRAGGHHHRLRVHWSDGRVLRQHSTSVRPRYPCLPDPAGCFTCGDDTEIDADTPLGPLGTGTVDVIVNGSTTRPKDQYSYVDPPTVTKCRQSSARGRHRYRGHGIQLLGSDGRDQRGQLRSSSTRPGLDPT